MSGGASRWNPRRREEARERGAPADREGNKKEKGARRGTLFIQEASAAAISHRLDSDRFEPLYAYRPETMLH